MDTHVESVAGAIFSLDRSSVLLIQRRDVPVWVLPGGGIDPGENSEMAIVREIFEETGFTVKVDRQVGRYLPENRLTRCTDVFECSILSGNMRITSETRDIQFFSLKALPSLIPPPFREWIEEAKEIKTPVIKKLTGVTYRTLAKNLLLHPILVLRFLLARAGFAINSSGQKKKSKYESK